MGGIIEVTWERMYPSNKSAGNYGVPAMTQDPAKLKELELAELKHGRLAMVHHLLRLRRRDPRIRAPLPVLERTPFVRDLSPSKERHRGQQWQRRPAPSPRVLPPAGVHTHPRRLVASPSDDELLYVTQLRRDTRQLQ